MHKRNRLDHLEIAEPIPDIEQWLRMSADWGVSSLVPISHGQEKYWHERLQSFADIVLAGKSKNPEKRFRELLVLQSDGGHAHQYAIAIPPHLAPAQWRLL